MTQAVEPMHAHTPFEDDDDDDDERPIGDPDEDEGDDDDDEDDDDEEPMQLARGVPWASGTRDGRGRPMTGQTRNAAAGRRSGDARERAKALQRGAQGAGSVRDDVERALDLLQPTIEAAIAEREVSHDQALVVVVVDPAAEEGAPFEESILVQRGFGRAGRVAVDYTRYAVDKARASLRERCDTSLLRERNGALLSAELPLVGGLHRKGWTVGVSGAVPAFDEALGAMVIELVCALQSMHAQRTPAEAAS